MKASIRLSMGLRIVICLTRERFHTRRRRKALIKTISTKMRNSVTASDLF